MEITYWKDEDILEINLKNKKEMERKKYKETGGEGPITVDFDKNNEPIRIEIMEASSFTDINKIKKINFKVKSKG